MPAVRVCLLTSLPFCWARMHMQFEMLLPKQTKNLVKSLLVRLHQDTWCICTTMPAVLSCIAVHVEPVQCEQQWAVSTPLKWSRKEEIRACAWETSMPSPTGPLARPHADSPYTMPYVTFFAFCRSSHVTGASAPHTSRPGGEIWRTVCPLH